MNSCEDSLASKFLNLVLKVTHNCNLRCSYCGQYKDNSEAMSFRVVANLTSKILDGPNVSAVNFIWHGGEPLLAGLDFYKKAVLLQEKCNRRGIKIYNSLQTNGSLVNEVWIDFLKETGFNVGISLDGPKQIHEKQRPLANGLSSYNSVMKTLRMLQENEIPYGVLSVVTENTLKIGPTRMFNFMLKNGINTFSFLQERPNYISEQETGFVSPKINLSMFNSFLQEVFDLWYKQNDPSIRIRDFTCILKMLFGGKSTICSYSGDCLGNDLCIDVNGDVYPCDRYIGDEKHKMGNIIFDDFEKIKTSPKLRHLIDINQERLTEHKHCKWFSICKGGCPFYAFLNDQTISSNEKNCAMAQLISHIYDKVHKEIMKSKIEKYCNSYV